MKISNFIPGFTLLIPCLGRQETLNKLQKANKLCEPSTVLVSMEFDIPNGDFHFNFYINFVT